MTILGINALHDRSAACSVSSTKQISALCDKRSRAFPTSIIQQLQNTYDSIDSVATVPHAANTVRQAMPRTKIEIVDYCEALSMATICSTDWNSCAILLSDSYYTKLGYYVDGTFYWIREFAYPNSLALFSAAATSFLGFDPLVSEDDARAISLRGNPTYKSWLESNVVAQGDGAYTILHNLERGIGIGVKNYDIATSVQNVISSILVNLASWLRSNIDIPRLAIVGRTASNYISNQELALLSGYTDVAAISLNGAAATALGAAAMIRRPLYEHHYIGLPVTQKISPEEMANKLLHGDIVSYRGEDEFSDNAFTNNNIYTIPYEPRLNNLTSSTVYAVCQDIDYHTYFSGKHKPYFGQYISDVKNRKALNYDRARVVTVAKNKNPYINRVLEFTRAQGYPILVSTPTK